MSEELGEHQFRFCVTFDIDPEIDDATTRENLERFLVELLNQSLPKMRELGAREYKRRGRCE